MRNHTTVESSQSLDTLYEINYADSHSSTDTLKQTLKSWSAGGHGEPGGVDIVNLLQTGL